MPRQRSLDEFEHGDSHQQGQSLGKRNVVKASHVLVEIGYVSVAELLSCLDVPGRAARMVELKESERSPKLDEFYKEHYDSYSKLLQGSKGLKGSKGLQDTKLYQKFHDRFYDDSEAFFLGDERKRENERNAADEEDTKERHLKRNCCFLIIRRRSGEGF